MIYTVHYSCGHDGDQDINGTPDEVIKKIKSLEKKGICKACYANKKRSEPLTLHIERFNKGTYTNYCEWLLLFFSGNTQAAREQIKAMGYQWGEMPSTRARDMFKKTDKKAWFKATRLEDLEIDLDEASVLAPQIQSLLTGIDLDIMEKHAPKNQDRIRRLKALHKPEAPDFFGGYTWNKKIYGRSIYMNGEKITLTTEQLDELDQYKKELAEYEEKARAIKDER